MHILLRGFWIGAIGLRSVQAKIDFQKLRYSDFFTERLPKKVASLDQLLVKLDNFSSVIFAFTFPGHIHVNLPFSCHRFYCVTYWILCH